MPRVKVPTPPIPALMALHSLYRRHRKEIPDPNNVTEKSYIESLTLALSTDNVIDGTSSANFVNKFRSYPYQQHMEDADGLSQEKLDLIAAIVIKHYKLNNGGAHPWNTFIKELFPTPTYLSHVDEKRYFKYLTEEDQNSVESYIERRMNEYGIGTDQIFNYTCYMWNPRELQATVGILQLNRTRNSAVFTYYNRIGTQSIPKAILRSDVNGVGKDSFYVGNNTLFLELREENPERSFVRMHFALAIHDQEFYDVDFLRGVWSSSSENASMPTASLLSCKKETDFFTARGIIENPASFDDLLSFDCINQRIDVHEQNIYDVKRFHSYRIFKNVQTAAGAYQFACVSQTGYFGRGGNIVVGNCFIEKNGLVTIHTTNTEPMKAYVDNCRFSGVDTLTISHFYSNGHDEFEFNYYLHIHYDETQSGRQVKHLRGASSGMYNGQPIVGDIIFFKKDFNSFAELSENSKVYVISSGTTIGKSEKVIIDEIKAMQEERKKRFYSGS